MKARNIEYVIDFSKYISERTRDFTGRGWVFKAINDWLAMPDGRFFILTGEPGSGKTAIASQLSQFSYGEVIPPDDLKYLKKGFLSAIHFCSARDRRWINPQVFAESLSLQLSERYPEYANALAKVLSEKRGDRKVDINLNQHVGTAEKVIGVIIKQDLSGLLPEDAFIYAVREPLEILYRETSRKQMVILVDALDEALLYSGEVSIVSLLAQADKLPEGVRFILTSRRDERVENKFPHAEGLFISASKFNDYNDRDITDYIEKQLNHDKELALKLEELKLNQIADLVKTITNKAAGNFQYINFLLDAITRGQQQLNELEKLPSGLDALYYESLGRVINLSNNDWSKDYSPLIGVLSVAQESMTQVQLQDFTGQSESMIWAHLGHLQQFIDEIDLKGKQIEEPRYRLYHQSFIDFFHRQSLVVENKRLRNSFYLQADEWHKKIVDYYQVENTSWDKVDCKRIDDYGLRNLAPHLYALKDLEVKNIKIYRQELYKLICKSLMIEKLGRFGSHQSFAADVELAIELARSEEPPDLIQEVRSVLIYATIASQANNIPLKILSLLAQVGQITKALGFAAMIQDIEKQCQAYRMIGEVLTSRYEMDEARRVLRQALAKAKEITDKYHRAEELGKIAGAFTQAKDNKGVIQVLETVEATELPVWITVGPGAELDSPEENAINRMVRELVKVGEIDRALSFATGIKNYTLRVHAQGNIAVTLAEIGEIDQAVATAKAIESSDSRNFWLCKVARALERIGKFDEAIDTIDEIETGSYSKVRAIVDLVKELCSMGDKERLTRILMVADAIDYGAYRVETLSWIAYAIAKVGDQDGVDRILTSVAGIEDEDKKAYVWSFIAPALASLGMVDKSIEVAGLLFASPYFYAKALNDVAWALAGAGKYDQALHVAKVTLLAIKDIKEEGTRNASLGLLTSTIAVAEDFDHALSLAASIENSEVKNKAMLEIIRNLIKAKKFDKALKTAHEIENEPDNTQALILIAKCLAQSGEVERSITTAQSISNETEKATLLSNLVEILAQTGDFDKALSLVASIENPNVKNKAMLEIVQNLTKAGKIDLAFSTAHEIENESDNAQALILIAEYLGKVGEVERSISIFRSISDIHEKTFALDRIVQDLIEARKLDQALETANEIKNESLRMVGRRYRAGFRLPTSDDKESVSFKTNALVEIAECSAQAGEFERSITIARSISNETKRSTTLSNLAEIFTQKGEMERAIEALEIISDKSARLDALGAIAQVLISLGRYDQATEIVNKELAIPQVVGYEQEKSIAISSIAQALAGLQEFDLALKATTSIEDGWDQVEPLGNIAQMLVRLGQIDRAMIVVGRGMDKSNRDYLRGEMTQALLKVPAIEQALAIAEIIEDGFRKVDSLCKVAQKLIQNGEKEKALVIAQDAQVTVDVINEKRSKASALCMVAQILAQADDKGKAMDLTERALDLVEGIEKKETKDYALIRIIETFILIGEFQRGIAFENKITDSHAKNWEVKVVIVKSLIQMKAFDHANRIIQDFGDDLKRETLIDLAEGLFQSGEKEKAIIAANQSISLAETDHNLYALANIAPVLARASERDKAVEAATKALALAKASDRHSIGYAAQTLAKVGEFDRALSAIEEVYDGKREMSHFLGSIIELLNQAGQQEKTLQAFQTNLVKMRMFGRESVFYLLRYSAPFLASLDQGKTLWKIYETILDIDDWWAK